MDLLQIVIDIHDNWEVFSRQLYKVPRIIVRIFRICGGVRIVLEISLVVIGISRIVVQVSRRVMGCPRQLWAITDSYGLSQIVWGCPESPGGILNSCEDMTEIFWDIPRVMGVSCMVLWRYTMKFWGYPGCMLEYPGQSWDSQVAVKISRRV